MATMAHTRMSLMRTIMAQNVTSVVASYSTGLVIDTFSEFGSATNRKGVEANELANARIPLEIGYSRRQAYRDCSAVVRRFVDRRGNLPRRCRCDHVVEDGTIHPTRKRRHSVCDRGYAADDQLDRPIEAN